MATVYYEKDAQLSDLQDKTVAIIGYGSQGHAHALNLRDSGIKTVVGLYKGSRSAVRAREDGFDVLTPEEAARQAQVVMLLVPDPVMPSVYQAIEPHLSKKALAFAHGFNIHFHQITPAPDVDVFMIAPKGPGHLVRRLYEDGQGTPALVAVHQDASGKALKIALAYAKGIGATRAGVIGTTFGEETESDLFGEQAVLCGGASELIKAGFDTLVEAGYQPEIAYFETLHELKLIVDLIYEGGIGNMWYSVSDTAKFGGLTRGRRVVDDRTRQTMRKILDEIQNGEFAREWILEDKAGRPVYRALQQKDADHRVEQVGSTLRPMMDWLSQKPIQGR